MKMNEERQFYEMSQPIEEIANEDVKNQLSDRKNINDRTETLTRLLHNYVDTYKSRVEQSKKMRDRFFMISIALLFLLSVGFPISIFAFMLRGIIQNVSAAVGLIAASASIVTSVIVLPKTIAEYLFSTEEDAKNADIVKEIIKSDLEIRNKLKENASDTDLDGGSY